MDNEENSKIYVLNKNEQLVAIFSNDDEEDVLINPRIEKRQNSEAVFTFTIDTRNPKWQEINNPENLYLVDGMVFSTNFDGSFKEVISENDENTIEVTAYERQQLLSRKFVRAWNSETNLEKIDTFMVVILSNGNLPLKNNGTEITTKYPKGSSGYALEGLLYGTGWTVGTCDIYEYENGEVVKDESGNPVYSKFDLETDQVNIYDNILKVQELWGGILVFDSYNKIVHHRDETLYLPYNGYEVRYQKNMQSLEKKYNNKIITKLCPLGEGGLNIINVNDGSVWLENYSYTDTVLEGIENNPDITNQTQLKRWGQRKLEMLCQPTIELDVNLALMYQLEGYELETIDLNHIVDVINYNDVDTDYMQLRVVEFSYSVWDRTDATIKLSNITLDSTDIFRKAVKATNIINTGTLEASKVINIYKGGQSVQQTLLVLDGKTEFTYSELTKADDGIIARVTHTEDNYNTLNGIVGKHTEEIGEWDITSGSISSKISATTSKLDTVSGDLKTTSSKVNNLDRTVSELNSKIQDIADITTYGESDRAEVELTDVNESEPIMIKVHPTSENISYLYPNNNLLPSDTRYLPDRIIRFTRTYEEDGTTKTENIDYLLPNDLLRYSDTVYDEFYLNYESQTCQVIKRCAYNADGTVKALGTETTIDYPYPTISLGEGNYTITLPGYDFGYLYVRLMAKNIYTTQFYTKVETDSRIDQKANEINLGVNQTLTNYSTTNEMNSAITLKANEITSTVSNTYETKNNAQTSYTQLQQTATSISTTVENNNTKANIIAKINDNTSSAKINADVISLSANDVLNLLAGNTINLSSKNINIQSNSFRVSTDGILECWEAIFRNAKLMGGDLNFYKANGDLVGRIRRATSSFDGTSAEALVLSTLKSTTPTFFIYFHNSSGDLTGPPILSISQKSTRNFDNLSSSSGYVGFIEIRQVVQVSNLIVSTIQPKGGNTVNVSGYVRATGFVNNSKESLKKDIEKYNDIALEIIKESEIYQYHFQKEDDTDKKHLGFVIGDLGGEYKTPNEVISQDGEGIDTYNMTSILWKAFQEYIEKTDAKIAQLEQEIKELKGGK